MPYAIIQRGKEYAVKSIDTGKLHGWTTKAKASAQLRLLETLYRKE